MKSLQIAVVITSLWAPTVLADDDSSNAMSKTLLSRTDFGVKSESLAAVVKRLNEYVREKLSEQSAASFEIRIMASDLKFEGITQNQRIRNLEKRERPLRDLLTLIAKETNGNQSVKDPSEAGQRIVWVVATDPDDDDRKLILITTRQGAKDRSFQLPKEFVQKEKQP